MQKHIFTFAAALAAFTGMGALNATAQEAAAPAAVAADASNCVEMVDGALRVLVPVLCSPELTGEQAIEAFNKATEQVDAAIMLARLDIDKARKDLNEYDKAGKGNAMDDLMDKSACAQLQKLLQTDVEVQKAFVKFISRLGDFDRILNGSLR